MPSLMCPKCHVVYDAPILNHGHPCPKRGCYEKLIDVDDVLVHVMPLLWKAGLKTCCSCGGHMEQDHMPYMSFVFDKEKDTSGFVKMCEKLFPDVDLETRCGHIENEDDQPVTVRMPSKSRSLKHKLVAQNMFIMKLIKLANDYNLENDEKDSECDPEYDLGFYVYACEELKRMEAEIAPLIKDGYWFDDDDNDKYCKLRTRACSILEMIIDLACEAQILDVEFTNDKYIKKKYKYLEFSVIACHGGDGDNIVLVLDDKPLSKKLAIENGHPNLWKAPFLEYAKEIHRLESGKQKGSFDEWLDKNIASVEQKYDEYRSTWPVFGRVATQLDNWGKHTIYNVRCEQNELPELPEKEAIELRNTLFHKQASPYAYNPKLKQYDVVWFQRDPETLEEIWLVDLRLEEKA